MTKISDTVLFTDATGQRHNALVTAIHGKEDADPSINIVIVSDDDRENDGYGRQIKRFTSVVSKARQPAAGMFYQAA